MLMKTLEELKDCGDTLSRLAVELAEEMIRIEAEQKALAEKAAGKAPDECRDTGKEASVKAADTGKDTGKAEEPVKPTLKDVRSLMVEKSRQGFTEEVRALVRKYGADRLSDVDPSDYPLLMADAEVLGNG